MREILLRGKRADNGEWIESKTIYSVLDKDERLLVYVPKRGSKTVCVEDEEGNIIAVEDTTMYKVLAETVGQYTGLTDKNGKKIFEGDIVRCARVYGGELWQGVVAFTVGCFCVKNGNVPAIDLFCEYEVIGNIHDNPELLTEATP